MKNVAVIFGSRSAEHDISIVTAISAIIEPLKLTSTYRPIPVYITKDGSWYSGDELGQIQFYSEGNISEKLSRLKKVQLLFDGGLWLVKDGLRSRKTRIDIVFPATHGTYGEDGSLMGLLRMANVPFVGCDLQASVVAMDKGLCKMVLKEAGLKSVPYAIVSASDFEKNHENTLKSLTGLQYPLFVKPVHLGSSIAISRVSSARELENAIEVAAFYDDGIIVEEAVVDLTEVTVPIIGNFELQPALVEEVMNRSADFFDFETKYLHGGKGKKSGKVQKGSYNRLPAKIPKELYDQCLSVATSAYKAIGASGIARVDLLIDNQTKAVYVNEINPLPGSLYCHNWVASGLSNVELVTRLLEFAEDRQAQRASKTTVFDTNFLKQF